MYKKYSPEEKLRFIKKSEAGGSIAAICREAGVSRTIFYRWVKQYKEAGEKGPKTLVTTDLGGQSTSAPIPSVRNASSLLP